MALAVHVIGVIVGGVISNLSVGSATVAVAIAVQFVVVLVISIACAPKAKFGMVISKVFPVDVPVPAVPPSIV